MTLDLRAYSLEAASTTTRRTSRGISKMPICKFPALRVVLLCAALLSPAARAQMMCPTALSPGPAAGQFSITALPPAAVGQPYTLTFVASGGTAPYSFSAADWAPLPAGLSISAGGVLSGTPAWVGTAAAFWINVNDGANCPAAFGYTLTSAMPQ